MKRAHKVDFLSEESVWVENTRDSKPWYSKTGSSVFALLTLALIDLSGFVQGAILYSQENLGTLIGTSTKETVFLCYTSLVVMVMGFLAAFEGATLYMAYAFSLKLYHYDRHAIKCTKKRKETVVLSKLISTSALGWISFAAFILGVISNIIFRIGIPDSTKGRAEITLTIVMIILPVITSILNFVIGCFTFDPILFELNHLAKKINDVQYRIELLKKKKNDVGKRLDEISRLREEQEEILKSKEIYVTSLRPALRSRVYEEAMNGV